MLNEWFEVVVNNETRELFNNPRTEAYAKAMGFHSVVSGCGCPDVLSLATDPGPYFLDIPTSKNQQNFFERRSGVVSQPTTATTVTKTLDVLDDCGNEIVLTAESDFRTSKQAAPIIAGSATTTDSSGVLGDCFVIPHVADGCDWGDPDLGFSVAPWWDKTKPCSYDFVGPILLDSANWGSTFSREIFPNALDGSSHGFARRDGRCVTFDFYLLAKSECGLEYGITYYDNLFSILNSCGKFDLYGANCCPTTDADPKDFLRHVRNVSVTTGPQVLETIKQGGSGSTTHDYLGGNRYYARVQFTLCSEDPWIFEEPELCLSGNYNNIPCEVAFICPPVRPTYEVREFLVDRTRYPIKLQRCGGVCKIGDWEWEETQLAGGDGVVVIADFEEADAVDCKPYQIIVGYDDVTGETAFSTLRWDLPADGYLPCDCPVVVDKILVRNPDFDADDGECIGNEEWTLEDAPGGDGCCFINLFFDASGTCGTWTPIGWTTELFVLPECPEDPPAPEPQPAIEPPPGVPGGPPIPEPDPDVFTPTTPMTDSATGETFESTELERQLILASLVLGAGGACANVCQPDNIVQVGGVNFGQLGSGPQVVGQWTIVNPDTGTSNIVEDGNGNLISGTIYYLDPVREIVLTCPLCVPVDAGCVPDPGVAPPGGFPPAGPVGIRTCFDPRNNPFPPIGCELVVWAPHCDVEPCATIDDCRIEIFPSINQWEPVNFDRDCNAAFPDPLCNYVLDFEQETDKICKPQEVLVDLPPCAEIPEGKEDVPRIIFPSFDAGECEDACWDTVTIPTSVDNGPSSCYQNPSNMAQDCCIYTNDSTTHSAVQQFTLNTGNSELRNFRIRAWEAQMENQVSPCDAGMRPNPSFDTDQCDYLNCAETLGMIIDTDGYIVTSGQTSFELTNMWNAYASCLGIATPLFDVTDDGAYQPAAGFEWVGLPFSRGCTRLIEDGQPMGGLTPSISPFDNCDPLVDFTVCDQFLGTFYCDQEEAWSLEIGLLPGNATLTVDGETGRVLLQRGNNTPETANRYISAKCGQAYRDFIAEPCKTYHIVAEFDCANTSNAASYELSFSRRAGSAIGLSLNASGAAGGI